MITEFKDILKRLKGREVTYDDMIKSISDDEYQELKNLNFSAELLFLTKCGFLESSWRNSEIYYKVKSERV